MIGQLKFYDISMKINDKHEGKYLCKVSNDKYIENVSFMNRNMDWMQATSCIIMTEAKLALLLDRLEKYGPRVLNFFNSIPFL